MIVFFKSVWYTITRFVNGFPQNILIHKKNGSISLSALMESCIDSRAAI